MKFAPQLNRLTFAGRGFAPQSCILLVVIAILAFCTPEAAVYPAYVPQGISDLPQGRLLRNEDAVGDLFVEGACTYTPIDVSGEEFTKALNVVVPERAVDPWDIQLRMTVDHAISAGDVFLFVFSARSRPTSSGNSRGWISALIEERGQWRRSLFAEVDLDTTWNQYVFAATSLVSTETNGTRCGFDFGCCAQSVEIGGIELVSFGKDILVDELLPFVTKITYRGREDTASWRAEAAQRIETHRKTDVKIVLSDGNAPVAGALVHARLTKQAFLFGAALDDRRIRSSRNQTYQEKFFENYNHAVLDNALKWDSWSEYNADLALTFLEENDIPVRGHNLLWPDWYHMPGWVSHDDPAVLAQQIDERLDYAVEKFKGRVVDWDVVNEPYSSHDAMDLLGRSAMVGWYNRVHEIDPDAKLYINDYDILSSNNPGHQDHYYEIIKFLIDSGAHLDGIGLQSHFSNTPIPPTEIYERLERFAGFGKEIKITEFDINTTDEQMQAEYTRDFMTVVFSHPSVKAILNWGYWEGDIWLPGVAGYRYDWSEKPNIQEYQQLVFEEWHTDTTVSTDSMGRCFLRGFKGDYEISITTNSTTSTTTVEAHDSGTVAIDLSTVGTRPAVGHIDQEPLAPTVLISSRRNSGVTIRIVSAQRQTWRLVATNMMGRTVGSWDGSGSAAISWQRPECAAGVHLLRIFHSGGTISRPFVLMR